MQLFQKAKALDRIKGIKGISSLEVVSHPRIIPEGKAQADSKVPQPRQVVSI
jgi:hypothetical protein